MGLAGCGSDNNNDTESSTSAPMPKVTVLPNGIKRFCDGPNAVYYSRIEAQVSGLNSATAASEAIAAVADPYHCPMDAGETYQPDGP